MFRFKITFTKSKTNLIDSVVTIFQQLCMALSFKCCAVFYISSYVVILARISKIKANEFVFCFKYFENKYFIANHKYVAKYKKIDLNFNSSNNLNLF